MQNLSNLNLGSLLSQGAAGNMPQPQVNPQQQPMHGQLQVIHEATFTSAAPVFQPAVAPLTACLHLQVMKCLTLGL